MFTSILQPTHMLIILIVALAVLGPKRLPEAGRAPGPGTQRVQELHHRRPEGRQPRSHQPLASPRRNPPGTDAHGPALRSTEPSAMIAGAGAGADRHQQPRGEYRLRMRLDRVDRGRDRRELRGRGTARPLLARPWRERRTNARVLGRRDLVYQRRGVRVVVLGGRSRRSAHAPTLALRTSSFLRGALLSHRCGPGVRRSWTTSTSRSRTRARSAPPTRCR